MVRREGFGCGEREGRKEMGRAGDEAAKRTGATQRVRVRYEYGSASTLVPYVNSDMSVWVYSFC